MEFIALITIGLVAGIALGVGGSIVMLPALTEVFGPDQHVYQSAAMIVNFFVVTPAVVLHKRAGAIEFAAVRRIIPLALIGVLAGVGLSELPVFAGSGESYLRAILGLFLGSAALYDLWRLVRRRSYVESHPSTDSKPQQLKLAAVAIPTGLVAGLLGVGGGLLAVPLQRRLLHIPIRNAIANSSALIIATSLVGAAAKNIAFWMEHGSVARPVFLAGLLIPTAIMGSMVGSRLTHRVPLKLVKTAFFLLLLVAAIRLIYSAIR